MAAPGVARSFGRSRMSGLAWRRARWGYVFIAPWLIGFVLFTAFPMVATLVFTFTNINLNQADPLRFVGLKNYETLLGDKQAWDALAVPQVRRACPAPGDLPAAAGGADAPF